MSIGSRRPTETRPSFGTVTETPGVAASAEQLAMLRTRYELARQAGSGRTVLEIACGSGIGLGYLVAESDLLVGSDIDAGNLAIASSTYRGRCDAPAGLVRHAAERLPFRDGSFDVVLLLEALYYLDDAEVALREARRVLAADGTLIVCSAHRHWTGFNPSPFSTSYLDGRELEGLLRKVGFAPEVSLAFEEDRGSPRGWMAAVAKRIAVRFGLIPSTMRGKALMKRIAFGSTVGLPSVLTAEAAPVVAPVPIDDVGDDRLGDFKVVYATGRVSEASWCR